MPFSKLEYSLSEPSYSTINHQHQKYPNAICCTCASRIGIEDNKILPYISWECIDYEIPPSFGVLAIGVGGVLYPPGSLYHMFGEEDIFMKYCPTADDLWLNKEID